MKKLFLSLVIITYLFSACSNDDSQDTMKVVEGSLKGKIAFEATNNSENGDLSSLRAASSTAIPQTTWDNIKQVQMFLYDSTGKVAFSYIIKPTSTTQEFTWTNVPTGTYRLALVANVKSSTDNVATSLDKGTTWSEFNDYNVRKLLINDNVYIDLKKTTFPSGHQFAASHMAYAETSEIFTAYKDGVVIQEGLTTDLSGTPLQLKREVSLMRVRINKSALGNNVHFDSPSNLIAIQRVPVGFGLKTTSFDGGIYDLASDPNRIMIGASGVETFKTANPTSGYAPTTILTDKFTLWHDIMVLPNTSASEDKGSLPLPANSRKYHIIISAQVDAGYKFANGTTALISQPVYWTATINDVFAKNKIREINITISSPGDPIIPEEPQPVGGLSIEVGAPEDWNSNISVSDIEV